MLLLHAYNSNSYVHKVSQDSLVWNDWILTQSGLQNWRCIGLCAWKVPQWTALGTSGLRVLLLVICPSLRLSSVVASQSKKKKKIPFHVFPKRPRKAPQIVELTMCGSIPKPMDPHIVRVQYPDWSGHVSAPFAELMCGVSPPWSTQTDSVGRVVFQRRIRALFSIGGVLQLNFQFKQGEKFTCLSLSHLFYRMEL